MIQEISVQNFLSIRDEQTISFVASKDNSSQEILTCEIKPNLRLLKLVVLYGANASGKTNLLLALEELWRLLFIPKVRKEELIRFLPFRLDGHSQTSPTKFSAVFYINSIRYQYSISYNKESILSEKMEYSPNGIRSLFYERKYNEQTGNPQIKFGDLLGLSPDAKKVIIANTLNNHTVLSTYAKVSVEAAPFNTVYLWLKDSVHEINDRESILDISKSALSNPDKKDFLLESLRNADFNISNFDVLDKPNTVSSSLREAVNNDEDIPVSVKDKILSPTREVLEFLHLTKDGEFPIEEGMQSRGTLEYYRMLTKLYEMKSSNHIYMIDEMEHHLHYDLVIHFLNSFLLNSDQSQLIITTHDQLLLDEDFIRRDMVWFSEKNRETAATEFYCANDFSLHKNLSLYKAYRSGRLGARPSTGSVYFEK